MLKRAFSGVFASLKRSTYQKRTTWALAHCDLAENPFSPFAEGG